jgi:PAS domain S-box-containing protein
MRERNRVFIGNQDKTNQQLIGRLTALLTEHAQEPVFLISPDLRFNYVNDATCLMLGHTPEELLDPSLCDLDKSLAFEKWPEFREQAKRGEAITFASRHCAQDRQIVPVEINANYLAFNGQGNGWAFVRDISGRQSAEEDAHAK